MKVSVVIPSYNMGRYLSNAIRSVSAQTWTDWEAIVVDDGSTDDTTAIVEQYRRADHRIRYIRQNRSGRASARNTGIFTALGERVAFLDADDEWEPTKLEKQIAYPWSYTIMREMSDDGTRGAIRAPRTLPQGMVHGALRRGNFVPMSSVMIRRDWLRPFDTDPQLTGAEDWDLWLRLSQRYPIVSIPEPLTIYRLHSNWQSCWTIWKGARGVMKKHRAGWSLHARLHLNMALYTLREYAVSR